MTKQESIRKAAEAAWEVTTKFRHPHKLKLKWVYRNMINRCYKPKARRYECYGGRGIKVCDEWRQEPTSFFEWAASHGYAPGLQLNRKDNDGDYTPDNCEFATPIAQANNTRKNHFLEFDGKRNTIANWSRELGISQSVIWHRVERGWENSRIFTQPARAPRYPKANQ